MYSSAERYRNRVFNDTLPVLIGSDVERLDMCLKEIFQDIKYVYGDTNDITYIDRLYEEYFVKGNTMKSIGIEYGVDISYIYSLIKSGIVKISSHIEYRVSLATLIHLKEVKDIINTKASEWIEYIVKNAEKEIRKVVNKKGLSEDDLIEDVFNCGYHASKQLDKLNCRTVKDLKDLIILPEEYKICKSLNCFCLSNFNFSPIHKSNVYEGENMKRYLEEEFLSTLKGGCDKK